MRNAKIVNEVLYKPKPPRAAKSPLPHGLKTPEKLRMVRSGTTENERNLPVGLQTARVKPRTLYKTKTLEHSRSLTDYEDLKKITSGESAEKLSQIILKIEFKHKRRGFQSWKTIYDKLNQRSHWHYNTQLICGLFFSWKTNVEKVKYVKANEDLIEKMKEFSKISKDDRELDSESSETSVDSKS